MSFSDFELHPKIIERALAQGFQTATPIQQQTIPLALAGRDIIGLAQTGTGKTAAFVLPMIHQLVQTKDKRHFPRGLIIAPTRELVDQVNEVVKTFTSGSGLRSGTFYGGTGYGAQLQMLRSGVDILVACPGRLQDLMDKNAVNLSQVQMLVLDEADQMFDMGFFPTIRSIIKRLPATRQNLMFSATMPDHIRKLAEEFQRNPEVIQVARLTPTGTVSQKLFPVGTPEMKTPLLLSFLKNIKPEESVLVFTRTKHRAKKLGTQISDAGFRGASIQGNLAQNKRAQAMSGFRNGKYQVLVATDIAARGIDVSHVAYVINYDIPDTLDAYTHRIGRTGRAERTGDAYTFITQEDRSLVRSFEREMGSVIERQILEGFDYQTDIASLLQQFEAQPIQPHRPRGGRPGFQGRSRSGSGPRRFGSDGPRRDSSSGDSRSGESRNRGSRNFGDRAPIRFEGSDSGPGGKSRHFYGRRKSA